MSDGNENRAVISYYTGHTIERCYNRSVLNVQSIRPFILFGMETDMLETPGNETASR